MTFSHPVMIILIIPLGLIVFVFFIRQSRAQQVLVKSVSKRFIRTISFYSTRLRLYLHTALLCAIGLSLILAAAAPKISGMVDAKSSSQRVVFLIDASLSMICNDVGSITGVEKSEYRITFATEIARSLIKAHPKHQYALVSFSGQSVIHSPFTRDLLVLDTYLQKLNTHNYQKPGTDFNAALESLLFLLRKSDLPCQAFLFSDGEELNGADFSATARALKKRGVPVHSILMGDDLAIELQLYEPADVYNNVDKPRIAKTITTKRDSQTLKKIARLSGGEYLEANSIGTLATLSGVMQEGDAKIYARKVGYKDISRLFILIASILFFIDIFFLYSLDDLISSWMRL